MRFPKVLAVTVLFLCSCAAPSRSPDSPYYVLPEGSRMVLLQTITIPPPGVSIWLQHGRVLSGTPDRYAAACKLEMRTRPEAERVITPDTFTVTRVDQSQQAVSIDSPFRRVVNGIDSDSDSAMAYEMRTVIYLESERQPEVYRLTCVHWDRPWFPEHLTLNQIAGTLVDIFRIEPREE